MLQFNLDLDSDGIEFSSEEKDTNGQPFILFTVNKNGTINQILPLISEIASSVE